MLVGGSPETQVVEQSCDDDVEVLVAGPTTLRKRLHVTASDFTDAVPADRTVGPTAAAPSSPKIRSRLARVSVK